MFFELIDGNWTPRRQLIDYKWCLVVWKGTDDLQTKADRAAQVYITQELHKKFPLASIIGEEGDNLTENLDDLVSPVGSPIQANDLPLGEILSKSVPTDLSSIQESEVI